MYKHILVPLDGSDLSIDTVSKAVEFATMMGARITFVHARGDFSVTDDGALTRIISPAVFVDQMAGNAKAILAKAETEARASGLVCDLVAKISDRPYEVIIDTAEECGCDLIFMASHGRRGLKGLVLGSQTQQVLAHAVIPVLVSSVESNLPFQEMNSAIAIIKGEHRSMGAVLGGLKHVLCNAKYAMDQANIKLLRAIVYYLRTFPETLHHPKEEEFLFACLRARLPESAVMLSQIEAQHHEHNGLLDAIEAALDAYEISQDQGHLNLLMAASDDYSEALWAHMSAEEKGVLPECRKHLNADDWKHIAQAFEKNGDPRFDAEREAGFDKLLARIMNLAPASSSSSAKSD